MAPLQSERWVTILGMLIIIDIDIRITCYKVSIQPRAGSTDFVLSTQIILVFPRELIWFVTTILGW